MVLIDGVFVIWVGEGGLGPNKGKHLPRSFTVCSDASPLLWEICVCCTQIPLYLGEIGVSEDILGPPCAEHSTSTSTHKDPS